MKAWSLGGFIAAVAASSCPLSASAWITATGGESGVVAREYIAHTFTNSGEFVVSGEGDVEILLVGGGGGGGGCIGGGGGGGGVIETNLHLTAGTYQITVGAGGRGSNSSNSLAENGESSLFVGNAVNIEAFGGGGGASASGTAGTKKGADGASGGGGAVRFGSTAADKYADGGAGIDGQGFAGGRGFLSSQQKTHFWQWSGGGGGAGGPGGDAWVNAAVTEGHAGTGGVGRVSLITGAAVYYGGGGGGGCEKTGPASGGLGGGGKGGTYSSSTAGEVPAQNGTDGLGGGGGGAPAWMSGTPQVTNLKGGDGGSGVVIVRYHRPTDIPFESVTAEGAKRSHVTGGYTVYTFPTNGEYEVSVDGFGAVELLLVGGGGGGGGCLGGGGGGGGVIATNVFLTTGTYRLKVGAGGVGGVDYSGDGQPGESSTFTVDEDCSLRPLAVAVAPEEQRS